MATAVAAGINIFLSVTIMATYSILYIWVRSGTEKQMTGMVCGQRNNSACLADWVEQKTHTAYCVLDWTSTRLLLLSAAASCPQPQYVGLRRVGAVGILGWDSHCFYCHTPKAKCYKPLKVRWGQVTYKLWKQTKKHVKGGQHATNGRSAFLNQQMLWRCLNCCVERGQSQIADQGYFQKCLTHITTLIYIWSIW